MIVTDYVSLKFKRTFAKRIKSQITKIKSILTFRKNKNETKQNLRKMR